MTRFPLSLALAIFLAGTLGLPAQDSLSGADMEKLVEQAEAGNAGAQYKMGLAYFNGRGVEQDLHQ